MTPTFPGASPSAPSSGSAPTFPGRTPLAIPASGGVSPQSRALDIWQEKLAFLEEQEAIAADANQRFALKKQIEEARDKIREHSGF